VALQTPVKHWYRGVVVEVLDTFFVCSVESFDDLAAQAEEVEGFCFEKPNEATLDKMAFASNRKAIECFIKESL